jgi:hypothetical protein
MCVRNFCCRPESSEPMEELWLTPSFLGRRIYLSAEGLLCTECFTGLGKTMIWESIEGCNPEKSLILSASWKKGIILAFMVSAFFLLCRWPPSCYVLLWRGKSSGVSFSSYEGTNPIMGAPPLWPSINLFISWWPHQLPLHWGLRLHHMKSGCEGETKSCQYPWEQFGRCSSKGEKNIHKEELIGPSELTELGKGGKGKW